MGVSTRGKSYFLQSELENGLGDPIFSGNGMKSVYISFSERLGYNEICDIIIRENKDEELKWQRRINNFTLAPYAFRGQDWIGYDDIESIAKKIKFALNMNLTGIYVWSIEDDDFLGNCHCVKFPLVKTISQVLAGNETIQNFDLFNTTEAVSCKNPEISFMTTTENPIESSTTPTRTENFSDFVANSTLLKDGQTGEFVTNRTIYAY